MTLGPFAEVSKPGRVQSSRRTRASASLKVGSGFGIPSRGPGRRWLAGVELVCPKCDEREQAEQGGRCACDGRVGPLALGLDTEMTTDLGKGHLDGPATDEPPEYVDWIGFEIGAQECLRPQFAGDIANQYIADWHEVSGMMPQGGARHDLYSPFAPSIPAGHLHTSPARLRIGQAFGQTGLARSDDARPSDRAWSAPSRRIKQTCIQAQTGDHANPASHRI